MNLDYQRLNAEQLTAVKHVRGPLLVLAGAGTGKTTVIAYRVGHLLTHGVAPESLLAVTFTNKAAREMRERLQRLLPQVAPGALTVSTFHSFCCRVLRRHGKQLGLQPGFGIADDGDTEDVVKEILVAQSLDQGELKAPFYISRISHAKNRLQSAADLRQAPQALDQTIGGVYQAYETRLRDLNLVDFDDLLLFVVRLWRERPAVLAEYRQRFEYLLVDEFQDTNHAQAELLRLLAGERRNLCVVGDDDQAIYGWRGADVSNILDFPHTYPGTTVVKLEENYRSSGGILQAANAAIANNTQRHGKELWTRQAGGHLPYLVVSDDNDAEARSVAQLLKHYAAEARIAYNDMAVLYRSNHLSRPFEIELRAQHVPYRVVGSKAFYERREIKDAAAYLRLVSNPRNELSLRRILNVPPRGLGTGALEKLQAYATQHQVTLLTALQDEAASAAQPPKVAAACRAFAAAFAAAFRAFGEPGDLASKIHDYLENIGYLGGLKRVYKNHEEAADRLGNIIEFANAAANFEQQQHGPAWLLDFLEANALADENDRIAEEQTDNQQGVSLMTVHAAKGLEFKVVIIVALEQNVFPHERALAGRDVTEERRLFYVAMTRAREHLALSRAKQRMRFGRRWPSPASQFLLELPSPLVSQGPPADLFRPASEDQVREHLARLQERLRAD